MKERPILFSTSMVEAILAGCKTQTRRIMKPQPEGNIIGCEHNDVKPFSYAREDYADDEYRCPYGKPGDLLWVRETWAKRVAWKVGDSSFYYKVDNSLSADFNRLDNRWKSSIHMPKEAARLWLRITNVRVERLQDISEQDAIAEGVTEYNDGIYRNYFTRKGLRERDGVECLLATGSFQSLWHSVNGPGSWEANPWVWVISFERAEKI